MASIATAIAERERTLYQDVWTGVSAYGAHAPGEHYLPLFLEMSQATMRGSVLDAGCGSGKGALALQAAGFEVTCCDITAAGLVPEAQALPFHQAVLWEPLKRQLGFRDWVYSCFPAGTVVGGSTMPIEQLTSGQAVGASNGDEQGVVRTYRHQYTGNLIKLGVSCVPDVSVTPDHPVLVSSLKRIHRKKSLYEHVVSDDQWTRAADVRPGDWVSVPRLTGSSDCMVSFQSGRSHRQIQRQVDEGASWLLGLYVAEGSTSYGKGREFGKGRLTLSLSSKEQGIANRAVCELARLSLRGSINHAPSLRAQHGLSVHASSLGFCRLLDEWCGKYAEHKTVPEAIKRASEPIVRAFILGLVDGDGCLRTDSRSSLQYYSVATVSKRLAYGLLELLHKIGVNARISNPTPGTAVIKGRQVSTLPFYTVAWQKRAWDGGRVLDAAGRSPYGRARFVNGRVYLEVDSVETQDVVDLPVYNLETSDHTYGVPYTVHNCDVLEHIPTAFTMLVASRLLEVARRGVFFSICFMPDAFGAWVGQPLHQTVMPYLWWREQLAAVGDVVEARDLLANGVFLVRPRQC